MNSEKVKEIKKALECCSSPSCTSDCPLCGYHSDDYRTLCRDKLIKDCLILINELEKENDEKYKRIMELEQDLVHADENVFYRECNVALQEDKIKAETLKHFTKSLKGKAIRRQEFIGELAIENIEYVKTQDIDKTLNEFLKGENNE